MTDFKIIQRHPRLVVEYHGFRIERFIGGYGFRGYRVILGKGYPTYYVNDALGDPVGHFYRFRREAAAFIDDYINGHALRDGTAVKDPGRSTATERS
jgi:hypothetical protein